MKSKLCGKLEQNSKKKVPDNDQASDMPQNNRPETGIRNTKMVQGERSVRSDWLILVADGLK